MKKIDFWRLVKANCEKNKKGCYGLACSYVYGECPLEVDSEECRLCAKKRNNKEALAYANKQIARHDQKCKKRIIPTKYTPDIQPDKTGAVLNKIVTLPKSNPTPLDIVKAIRDNGYGCESLTKNCFMYSCPFGLSSEPECPKKNRDIAKRIIDDYISKHDSEPVKAFEGCEFLNKKDNMCDRYMPCGNKACPHYDKKPTEPKPISLPDAVYLASKFGVSFVNTKDKTFTTNEKGELFINNEPCFTIPEEALAVALKRWQK